MTMILYDSVITDEYCINALDWFRNLMFTVSKSTLNFLNLERFFILRDFLLSHLPSKQWLMWIHYFHFSVMYWFCVVGRSLYHFRLVWFQVLKLHTKLGKPIPSTDPVVVTSSSATTGKTTTSTATTAGVTMGGKPISKNITPVVAASKKVLVATPKITFVGRFHGIFWKCERYWKYCANNCLTFFVISILLII